MSHAATSGGDSSAGATCVPTQRWRKAKRMFAGIVEELGEVVATDEMPPGRRLVIAGPRGCRGCEDRRQHRRQRLLPDGRPADRGADWRLTPARKPYSEPTWANCNRDTVSTWNARCKSAIDSADTSSPAMSMPLAWFTSGTTIVNGRLSGSAVRVGLTREMAIKGSVAVDGVSLTLVDVLDDRFSVALIPHTLQVHDARPKITRHAPSTWKRTCWRNTCGDNWKAHQTT